MTEKYHAMEPYVVCGLDEKDMRGIEYKYNCNTCGCNLFSPESKPEQTVWWHEVSRRVLCSDHQDIADGTLTHPKLAPRWAFKN